jgi:hypothetical protein
VWSKTEKSMVAKSLDKQYQFQRLQVFLTHKSINSNQDQTKQVYVGESIFLRKWSNKLGREKDRKRNRKRRRRRKLHKLKARLAQTKNPKERQRLIQKILRISIYPPMDIPRE